MKALRTRLAPLALASALALGAQPARADPGTFAVALSTFLEIETAVAITTALYTYGAYVLASYAVYGSISARNKAKRAQAAARAAYNSGLQDRNITALQAAPGRRIVYGRCDTGGDLVAIFTSDKLSHSLAGFRLGFLTKADAYKHLIIVWAAHQCQAVNDIKIDGIPVGALDANGWATGTEWAKSDPKPTAYGQLTGDLRSKTLPSGSTIISVTLITGADGTTHTPIANGAGGWSFAGTTLTLPGSVTVAGFAYTPTAADTWDIAYSADDIDGTSTVRVRHHLGAPDQAADAELMALLPDEWTSDHRLRGRCYSWITLDLERPQFQGGPPGITADISGALVLDPRTGTTAWSENSALCGYDYLRRVEGMNVTAAEVDVASVIAAANDCDVTTSFTIGGTTVSGPRYTCNGVFVAGQAKEAVLIDICESMAGFHTYSGTWRLLAGSWTPPVMDLTDDDLFGSISIVQAGEPSGELINTVRGQYVPAGSSVPADIETYSNPTFVTADRRSLITDVELPFTNSRARAKNISRIKVEQSRAGEVIFFPAKLRAWPLQTGDRVTVTSAEYGFASKVYRVTDWQFGLRSPVGLTLQEDGPDIYDEADAAVPDPTPNTGLPSPWKVPTLTGVTAASGTAQLQRLGDGTVISRVLVSWDRTTAPYMDGGRIEISWREAGTTVTHLVAADAGDTQAYLTGVRDGAALVIDVTAVNSQGARSAPKWVGHRVVGKSQAPSNVSGLTASVIPGAVHIAWNFCTDLDYDYTILRYGVSWAAGTTLPFNRPGNSYDWPWPAAGTYTVWAVNVDTSGNPSATPQSFGPFSVTTAALAPANASLSIKLNVGDFAGTVNYNEAYIHGRDASGAAVDQPGTILVNGVATPVPNGNLYTNQGPVAGYIVWDSSGDTFPTGAGNRPYVLGRRRAGVWEYDDNSAGWVAFTPTATRLVIGTLESGSTDTGNPGSAPGLVASSIWAAASTLNALEATADAAYAEAVAAATVVLVNDGGMTIQGNTATKTGGTDGNWDGSIRSKDSFAGGAFVSWVVVDITKSLGLGLNTDPTTNTSYNSVDAWLYNSGTELYVYNNGTVQNGGTKVGDVANGDVLAVSYDGSNFRYYRNGAVLFTQAATVTAPLFLDSSFNHMGGKVTNVQFGPLTSNAWTSIGGRPKSFRVCSVGYGAALAGTNPYPAGLFNGETGAGILGIGSMYQVIKIDRATLAVTDLGTYNTLAGGSNPANMAAALNAIPAGTHIVVVASYDEPQGNRLTGGLLAAMLRHGASRSVFGSSDFHYRAAYILVGISGCGEGNGAEVYAGAVDNDTNAFCELAFSVLSGNLTVSGTTSGARSLVDYGYTGDLAATKNVVTYSASAPGSPTDGDIWIDTSVTPRTIRMRLGGTWQLAGTYVNGTAQITDDANLGLTALWAGVAGTGKPADYATRNPVYFQDTDPGSVPDGSIWISSTKAWQRISGVWKPYVGTGSVGTGELATGAATDVLVTSAADIDIFRSDGSSVLVMSLTYTATVDCDVLVSSAGVVDQVCSSAQWSTFADIITSGFTASASNVRARNSSASDPYATGSLGITRRYFQAAGSSVTYALVGNSGGFARTGPQAGCAANFRNLQMRLEAVKR